MTAAPLARIAREATDADDALLRFVGQIGERGMTLYPAQEEAILELYSGKHVILNTPTGSGKSLVATALHLRALQAGARSYYTCPIKALVNEKFFALCDEFGAENVGMQTGDAAINAGAPIVCATAEVLANLVLRDGPAAAPGWVVMDEFHYYGDKERGWAWQVPLLACDQTTFLLMSATLGDTSAIARGLEELTGRQVAQIFSARRPVPLSFEYRETPLHETIEQLVAAGRAPIYLVNFTQRAAAEQAQSLTSVNLATKEEKAAIQAALGDTRFDTPYAKDLLRFVKAGVGVHHAGLLPKYRLTVEKLAQKGLLKVVSGTDTLGMGVNIPIRTVLFTQLCKYDGEKTAILSVREFHQIAGRAGRKGFDEQGFVVAQAPAHVIENLRLAEKKAQGKKVTMQKPPERGYVHWDRQTFQRLQERPPEPLESRFQVTHGMLLQTLQGDPRGYRRLVQIIGRAHATPGGRSRHRRQAALLFRTLRKAGIVELVLDERARHPLVEVNAELQRDFSLNHTLSLYLVDTLPLLDPASESYALDVLSLVESILENPQVVLFAQVDKLKGELVASLKAAGVEYAERMEELEKVEHPKPLAELIYDTFNAFAEKHPWVGRENIRPKSVARDLMERFCSFNDYVREYGLMRAEGVLLRYLSQAYKTLLQNVPGSFRTEALDDLIEELGGVIRAVDSSLLDEWLSLKDGPRPPGEAPAAAPPEPVDLRRDARARAARLRRELHRLLRPLAQRRWEEAAALLVDPPSPAALEEAFRPFFAAAGALDVTPRARRPDRTHVSAGPDPDSFVAAQRLLAVGVDEEESEWTLECAVDLSRPVADEPLLRFLGLRG